MKDISGCLDVRMVSPENVEGRAKALEILSKLSQKLRYRGEERTSYKALAHVLNIADPSHLPTHC